MHSWSYNIKFPSTPTNNKDDKKLLLLYTKNVTALPIILRMYLWNKHGKISTSRFHKTMANYALIFKRFTGRYSYLPGSQPLSTNTVVHLIKSSYDANKDNDIFSALIYDLKC